MADRIGRSAGDAQVIGLAGAARALYLAALQERLGRPLAVVVASNFHAQRLAEEIRVFLGEEGVWYYPGEEIFLRDPRDGGHEERRMRLRVIRELLTARRPRVLVTSLAGWTTPLPPPEVFRRLELRLAPRVEIPLEAVVRRLLLLGYRRAEEVAVPGEFSVRGGILDVYSPLEDDPYRIEWFGDEVDTVRVYDLASGRSRKQAEEFVLFPVYEGCYPRELLGRLVERVDALWEAASVRRGDAAWRERLAQAWGEEKADLLQGILHPRATRYVRLAYEPPAHISDFLGSGVVYVFDEPTRLAEAAEQREREEGEWQVGELEAGRLLPGVTLSFSFAELSARAHPRLELSLFPKAGRSGGLSVSYVSRTAQEFHGQLPLLKGEVERLTRAGFFVLFLAPSEEGVQRMARVFEDYGIAAEPLVTLPVPLPRRPVIVRGALERGFEIRSVKLAVFAEGDLFVRRTKASKPRAPRVANAEKIHDLFDLRPGDYVVHVHHGIGRFQGLETLTVGGVSKDYLLVRYAGGDLLYVPVEQLNLLQKYLSAEGHEPKLHRLGGGEWKRAKARARRSAQEMAEELLKIYAARMRLPGFAFDLDNELVRAFEATFPYEETPDQLRAIAEVKRDMESPRPMDRLLVGDVGYGKTEVALRAAFKAVMSGKQVAVLVPTTILAQQHLQTFRERLEGFPVRVEMLSRFRSRREQKEILRRLAQGEIDILIGTHRLLSDDVVFRDLGLLIVDEEQRFGVGHKEKIKKMATQIDVLTLTATPIPRTLHMALAGIRDMSVIETPPKDRFPVQTYVLEYSPVVVREAIERELGRGGQVFVVYNRVQGIHRVAAEVQALVPEARVAVAHGQMDEEELERVMLAFLEREIDVLVTTTIIETGVDIPNVNTLIVLDADTLGLAQLYQLRGRVGRSNRIAYAYFTYRPGKNLTPEAEKRLEAIREFTELGAGFKIAMRDLAIRGAGNLLGPEQHGHIAAVGLELFTGMLREAVSELKGEEVPAQSQRRLEINVNVDAYFPNTYVPSPTQKISLYRRLAELTRLEDWQELVDEVVDRFGTPPPPAERLLLVAKVRALACELGIELVTYEAGALRARFAPERAKALPREELFALLERFSPRVSLFSGEGYGVMVRGKESELPVLLERLATFLLALRETLLRASGGADVPPDGRVPVAE
ncbi:MAG: transcription-repair coupling factor [Brockia lithotrophica]|nr:transcription-repair coupling factor [Brockia lithotrophica]